MKKIVFIFATVVLALSSVSCQKQLDIDQQGVIPQSNYYKTDDDCQKATTALYNMLISSSYRNWFYDWCLTSYVSDDTYLNAEALNPEAKHLKVGFSIPLNDSDLTKCYKAWYFTVYRANLIIDNFKNGTSLIQKQAVAEALVLRALAYSRIICFWGDAPKVDHVLSGSAEYRQPNCPRAELWDWTIASLKEAIEMNALPSKANKTDVVVRVTQEFAWALKGKCEVFAGKYADAKVSLKKIIESNLYDLVPGSEMENLLKKPGNWSCESVFEENLQQPGTTVGTGNALSDQFPAFCAPRHNYYGVVEGTSFFSTHLSDKAWSHFQPTKEFIDAFLAKEGKSTRFTAWIKSYEDLLALGLKHLETNNPAAAALETESSKINIALASYLVQESCGYWMWKQVMYKDRDWLDPSSYKYDAANQKFMRYADVLLLYAEACAQAGDDGSGLAALNKVQDRAGAPKTALTLDNVKAERRFELFGEGFRFFDLVRWGDAATKLADHYKTVPVFYGYKAGTTEYDIRWYTYPETGFGDRGFKVGKNELFPYPSSEIAANPMLKQNPGW